MGMFDKNSHKHTTNVCRSTQQPYRFPWYISIIFKFVVCVCICSDHFEFMSIFLELWSHGIDTLAYVISKMEEDTG